MYWITKKEAPLQTHFLLSYLVFRLAFCYTTEVGTSIFPVACFLVFPTNLLDVIILFFEVSRYFFCYVLFACCFLCLLLFTLSYDMVNFVLLLFSSLGIIWRKLIFSIAIYQVWTCEIIKIKLTLFKWYISRFKTINSNNNFRYNK